MRLILLLSLLLFLGCTQQPQHEPLLTNSEKNVTSKQEGSIILLLDNHKEHNGIVVSTAADSVLVDKANTFVNIESNESKPSDAKVMDQEQIDALFGTTLKALPETPTKFVIYFERNSYDLTPKNIETLQKAVEQIRLREPCEMVVMGYTDRKGSLKYNRILSKKRVDNTLSWVKGHELEIISIKKIYKGEEDLSIVTEDEMLEPLNRRVELYIR